MPVFAIVSNIPNPELEAEAKRKYASNMTRLNDNTFFVRNNGTAQMLTEQLGIITKKMSGTVVFRLVGDYYGLSNSTFWDWVKEAFEEENG